jgi:hypothetical protein
MKVDASSLVSIAEDAGLDGPERSSGGLAVPESRAVERLAMGMDRQSIGMRRLYCQRNCPWTIRTLVK